MTEDVMFGGLGGVGGPVAPPVQLAGGAAQDK